MRRRWVPSVKSMITHQTSTIILPQHPLHTYKVEVNSGLVTSAWCPIAGRPNGVDAPVTLRFVDLRIVEARGEPPMPNDGYWEICG